MAVRMPIYILGAGGFAREVAWLLEEINAAHADAPPFELRGFVAPDFSPEDAALSDCPYCGTEEWLFAQPGPFAATIAIGNPKVLRAVSQRFAARGDIAFPALVHPSTVAQWRRVRIGAGAIVCAGNLLTTNVEIGAHAIVNLGCTIGHEAKIGECSVLSPGVHVSGGVTIGAGSFLGTGSVIQQNLAVGEGATIGAQSFVNKNVDAGATVVGVPAKPLERKS